MKKSNKTLLDKLIDDSKKKWTKHINRLIFESLIIRNIKDKNKIRKQLKKTQKYIAYYNDYHSHIYRNIFKANNDEEAIKIFDADSWYSDDELYRIEGERQIKII